MIDHLSIARAFLEEQLAKRDDIVAAYIYGSVVRGDATEDSDIDMAIVIAGEPDTTKYRGGVDGWRNGTYIEASLQPKAAYEDPERVLAEPFKATPFYHSLIIHDPTGVLTEAYRHVRSVYMEPRWLKVRVDFWLNTSQDSLPRLSAAIGAGDNLAICVSYFYAVAGTYVIPLLMAGVNMSMARCIIQLADIHPDLSDRICELDGSERLDAAALKALLSLLVESQSHMNPDAVGEGVEYWLKRIESTIDQGEYRQALTNMWMIVSGLMGEIEKSEDDSVRAAGTELSTQWLRDIGWEGIEIRKQKLETLQSLWSYIVALIANLDPVCLY